jgi:hypothetical protein
MLSLMTSSCRAESVSLMGDGNIGPAAKRASAAASPPAEPRTTPDYLSDPLPLALPIAPPPPPKPASTTLTDEQLNKMHKNKWRCQYALPSVDMNY